MLLALAGLSERLFGQGFSALGFLPSVLALALYSMLPVLRNTVTGLERHRPRRCAKPRALFGADARRSRMRDIELPLAMPVIMAGIRTSAVWVIGTATLSTPIGQTSLGNYIFAGLQTQNWVFVLFGCVAAAVLALIVDQLLALMERGVAFASPQHGRCRRHRPGAGACWPRCCQALAARKAATLDRRQAVHRAIRAGRADRAAARGARPVRASGATGSAPASSSMRSSPTTSTSMSIIPARSGPTRCTAPTSSRAPKCWPRFRAGSRPRTASACSARSASRTPMRWRCRASRRRNSASARSPIWPRMPAS